MDSITVAANAKINLTLDILGKKSNGYHIVDMVMQTVNLYDSIYIKRSDKPQIELICSKPFIPLDLRNTAYKAAELFLKNTEIKCGLSIKIEKRIPAQAGLAGGSADAAGVLIGLNKMFDNPLSETALLSIAAEIGSDVPFCVEGGTMLATDTGTKLERINCCFPESLIIIVKPKINVSTKEAYEACDNNKFDSVPKSGVLIEALKKHDLESVSKLLYNRFEDVLKLKEIEDIKSKMLSLGALGASMSGSGSAVFGIFSDAFKAEQCKQILSENYDEVFAAYPVNYGVKITD